MLHGEGYNVETFSNPHEAPVHFIYADKSYYDLVILDIRTPDLNGLTISCVVVYRVKTSLSKLLLLLISIVAP
jgi:DNA-binding response OmpR family regulator